MMMIMRYKLFKKKVTSEFKPVKKTPAKNAPAKKEIKSIKKTPIKSSP